jgi:AbiEi antitoxin C-terminal domain
VRFTGWVGARGRRTVSAQCWCCSRGDPARLIRHHRGVATEAHIRIDIAGECAPRSVDAEIAALAGRHARDGAWMAAVLAGGDGAVLSHRSAAALWGIRDTDRSRIELTVPRHRRGRPRVEYHQIVLPPDEVTRHRGIPVTNPARTLLDLAAILTAQQLEHALNEAEIRRLTSPLPLDALVARHPGRKGIAAITRALDNQRQTGETITKSEFERRFLALLDAHAIPRPSTNTPLGPYEPDAVWTHERLVVELDSYPIHTTRRAFERDRARDRALQAAG